MKVILVKYLKRIAYLTFLLFASLILLELSFRFQLIEFYGSELNGLNTEKQLQSEENNVLVFGDSFTAHPDSYVKKLREEIPSFNFVNSAIPGTGIKQHELLFKKRIKTFMPKAIIYQFYVGNDFLDIEHPVNLNELSFFRNVFWKVSEQFLIAQYINQRLAFLNKNNQSIQKLQEESFSKEVYNHRVKTYYLADSSALLHTILMDDQKTQKVYKQWKEKLAAIKEITADSIPIFLLITPHNAQVSRTCLNRNKQLGAALSSEVLALDYPLFQVMEKDFKSWELINPLEEFQSFSDSVNLYYENDPHLTKLGQEVLGEIVVNKIRSKQ